MTGQSKFLAHISEDGREQSVEEHLDGTAKLAEGFFTFDPKLARLAKAAAKLHDIGKFSDKFQEYIKSEDESFKKKWHGKIDHATAGAQVADGHFTDMKELPIARILEYTIAGHHSGLANGSAKDAGDRASLEKRLVKENIPPIGDRAGKYAEKPDLALEDIKFVCDGTKDPKNIAFRMSFLIRMVFSALVDADWLDTERFMNRAQYDSRGKCPLLEELSAKLDEELAEFESLKDESDLNRNRNLVLEACRNAAELDPGLFTLTVPTGGGKTLSSLAFALKHAIKHGMDRVIYVIPYTSIIEQNAKVFRDALGYLDFDNIEAKIGYKNSIILRHALGDLSYSVVEHHSNFEEKNDGYNFKGDKETTAHDLACENWDAPIIVTTNVQFFESLFASRKTRCRKLHNIMNSVVILDEAQMLPVNLLRPCIEAIRELSGRYRTTVVLCTATQPALNRRDDFKFGLEGTREIVGVETGNETEEEKRKVVIELYEKLKRVEVEFIEGKDSKKITDNELVERIKAHEQVLCIVNTKGHAKALYKMLAEECDEKNLFHLSTNLCPAHRSKVFNDEIRPRLDSDNPKPCVVISTQLVEAGVDIDFPTVYRATAGIDSIAQAAGRCNREGKRDIGKTYVFESEHKIPDALHSIKQAAEVAEGINRRHAGEIDKGDFDLLGLRAVDEFFKELFWLKGPDQLDSKKIIESLAKEISKAFFPFRDIAQVFRLIDSPTTAVFIEYDDRAKEIAAKFRGYEPPNSKDYRAVQRYTVSLYAKDFNKIRPALEETESGMFILPKKVGKYNEKVGIVLDNNIDPTNLYISNLE